MHEFNVEELQNKLNDLEIQAKKHKIIRDEYNGQVISSKRERDELTKRKKNVYDQIESSRADREKHNKLVRDAKERRNTANKNFNTERQSDNPDEKELKRMSEISDAVHQEVVEYAQAAQAAHDLMGELSSEVKDMNNDHQTVHTNFVESKKKADESHQSFHSCIRSKNAINLILQQISTDEEGESKEVESINEEIEKIEPLTQEQIEKLQDVVIGFYDEKTERDAESITSICVEGAIVNVEIGNKKSIGRLIGKRGLLVKEIEQKLKSEFGIEKIKIIGEGYQGKQSNSTRSTNKKLKYICPICDEEFSKLASLRTHKINTGHGAYTCDDCSIILPEEQDKEGHTGITGHNNFSGDYVDQKSITE